MGISSCVYFPGELIVLLVCSFSCWSICLLIYRNSLCIVGTILVSPIHCKYLLPVCGLFLLWLYHSLITLALFWLFDRSCGTRLWYVFHRSAGTFFISLLKCANCGFHVFCNLVKFCLLALSVTDCAILKSPLYWDIYENWPCLKKEAGLNMFYRICIMKITFPEDHAFRNYF